MPEVDQCAGRQVELVDTLLGRNPADRLEVEDDQQRGQHRPGPIGKPVAIEDEPGRQQDDLRWHRRDPAPVVLIEQRQRDLGEHVRSDDAALAQDHRAGLLHEGLGGRHAAELQREVSLHRCADLGGAAVVDRPPTLRHLGVDQVAHGLPLFLRIHAAQEAAQQEILGSQRRVGFQFMNPVPCLRLALQQPLLASLDTLVNGIAFVRDALAGNLSWIVRPLVGRIR